MKNLTFLTLALACLFTASNRAPAAVVINEGMFDNGDYSLISSEAEIGYPSGSGSFAQYTAGGSPGDFQEDIFSTNTTPVAGQSYPYGVFGAAIDNLANYDPGTEGAISSLDFSADFKSDQAGDPSFYIYFFVEQNGYIYRSPTNLTDPGNQLTPDWTLYSDAETTSSTFVNRNPNAPALNFSATGAPIYFGAGVHFLSTATETSGFDIDNFVVDVDAPEPSTSELILGSFATLAFFGRRRQLNA
jgi:hypothetical protein